MTDSPHDAHRVIGYLSAMAVFGTGLAASGLLARARSRSLPAHYDAADLPVGAGVRSYVGGPVSR